MEFSILGPVAVTASGAQLPIGGLRDRLVLAGLLMRAGRPVGADELIDLVWDDPPGTARQQLRTVVHRLRNVIDGVGGPAVLRTVAAGYQLDVPAESLDAVRFSAGVSDARRLVAGGALAEAVEAFQRALGLWRGPALAGLPGTVIAGHAAGLEEQRLAAVEECADAELRLGEHRPLIPRLQQLAAEHPVRERLAALLMTAFVRDGRRSEAIDVYQSLARRLREDLGIDPGEQARAAYLAAIAEPVGAGAADAPRFLPRAPQRLVGRSGELERLLALDAPVVAVIDGMAGVGKSALALTAAHAAGERFPDARLFINLRGHSEQPPLTAHEALGTLLRQLDPDPRGVPDQPADRVAQWRARLRDRRAVVVLDNAADSAQIEPLLPAGGEALVLVTSRARLSPEGGAVSVSLEPLAPDAAVELLRQTADERVSDDPEAAAAIVALCGRLPLAIHLVGHRLRHRPQWTPGMMQAQLAAAAPAPITVSVEGRTTAAAFALSYRHLSESRQRLFRRLGLHPAGAFAVWAAAALAELPADETEDLLDDLVEANLVQADLPGQYRLHDLLRVFAASLVGDEERASATVRMLDAYLSVLTDAGRRGEVRRWQPRPRPFGSAASAATWTYANWSTITALIGVAEAVGAHRHTALLVRMVIRPASVAGRNSDALPLVDRALAAADALGDDELAADTHKMAGALFLAAGRPAECRASVERALALYSRLGNQPMADSMRAHMITLLRHEGRHGEAVRATEEAVAPARATGDRLAEAVALSEGANVLHELGRDREAKPMLLAAVRLLRDRKDDTLSITLGTLGSVLTTLGETAAATGVLLWAIRLKQQFGNVGGAAEALSDYGRLLAANGDPEAGLRLQQLAYRQASALDYDYFEPLIGNHIGATLSLLGRFPEAVTHHRKALRQARARQWPFQQARALAGLAVALRPTDPAAAETARTEAVALDRAIGIDLTQAGPAAPVRAPV
ncbi:BTAD domain-containing putative transcriptional regulator [Dactylosporangium sp. CS-033363]|uniref:AfsR/SARP family transcriptional regulator n=1 Tax=Dactylosporangium sp. CS-033363 TaxID=3239935 RepID=UPI003D8EB568